MTENWIQRRLRDFFNEYVVQPIGIDLVQLGRKVDKQMSELSDAVAAVADDQKRIGADVKAVLGLLQQPNPDVAAAVTALKGIDGALDASAEALEAAAPPVA